MTPRRALWALVLISGVLRLVWASSIGPGNDEAYHYLFTLHPAWSYFDHPPMLAVIESVGLWLAGGVVTSMTLRLGFILLFAGSTWLMYRLTTRLFGERAGFFAAFALNVTGYHTAAAATFALPDGPLLFFWLLTLDRLIVALDLATGEDRPERDARQRPRSWPWVAVGLAWGGALLSKYHAVFLPAGVFLYLVIEPSARRWLMRPGPYLAVLVGALLFTPVVAWNATHGWVSFVFQGARAIGQSGFRIDFLLAALFLPALYLFPWIWVWLVALLIRKGRPLFRSDTPRVDRFLVTQAVLPMATFLGVACTRPVLPHWTLVGFLPLFPILGQAWATDLRSTKSRRRRMIVMAATPVLVMGIVVFEAKTGFFQTGRAGGIGLVTAAHDPTAEMVRWDAIEDELRRRGLLDRPDTFLFTGSWYQSGQVGFATRNSKMPVLCYHGWDARSFAFWSVPDEWVGRDGILLAFNERAEDVGGYVPWFEKIVALGGFEVKRAGAPIRKVGLYLCIGQKRAFPFDDLGRTLRPKHEQTVKRFAAESVSKALR
jgi:4-amino-4-deoxy-L-arabinose transferase-like glycosyltransferase